MGETESQYGRNWVSKTGEIATRFRLFSRPILELFLPYFFRSVNDNLTSFKEFATLQVYVVIRI